MHVELPNGMAMIWRRTLDWKRRENYGGSFDHGIFGRVYRADHGRRSRISTRKRRSNDWSCKENEPDHSVSSRIHSSSSRTKWKMVAMRTGNGQKNAWDTSYRWLSRPFDELGMLEAIINGCMVGARGSKGGLLAKPWKIMTTSKVMANRMNLR